MMRRLRTLISLALISFLLLRYGEELMETLRGTQARWIAAALVISVAQVVLSAWRWRFTAHHLAVPFPLRTAIGEYYLSTLVNQILPGGVLGDAQRAWRHSRHTPHWQLPAQAVVLERSAGQLAMFGLLLLSWPWLPPTITADINLKLIILPTALILGLILVLFRGWPSLRLILPEWITDWARAARTALFAREVLPIQLIVSVIIAASYLGIYACCVMAIQPVAGGSVWLPLLPLVLLAMLIPITIAGWGLREGTAAVLWPLAGLPVTEGISAAVLYGVVCLTASLPGLLVISRR